ncbi:MAG: hypothetical protein JST68_29410 [Bacteroidetes bacterium]|nr:hypothetical protein [Bacteroidota bacterium]
MKKAIKRDTNTLKEALRDLNRYDLRDYLKILGHEPLGTSGHATYYRSPFDIHGKDYMIVNHYNNAFLDLHRNAKGKLTDFACALFDVSPEKLCKNIAFYRLHELMSEESPA